MDIFTVNHKGLFGNSLGFLLQDENTSAMYCSTFVTVFNLGFVKDIVGYLYTHLYLMATCPFEVFLQTKGIRMRVGSKC